MEYCLVRSHKAVNTYTLWLIIPSVVYTQRNVYMYAPKDMYMTIHGDNTENSSKLETLQMSCNRKDKHIHIIEYETSVEIKIMATCNNMDKSFWVKETKKRVCVICVFSHRQKWSLLGKKGTW